MGCQQGKEACLGTRELDGRSARRIYVVRTDEASIQLESHRRHSFRKAGCQPRPKPRYNTYSIHMGVLYPVCMHVQVCVIPLLLFSTELNIQSKCMCGQGLAGLERQKLLCLRE